MFYFCKEICIYLHLHFRIFYFGKHVKPFLKIYFKMCKTNRAQPNGCGKMLYYILLLGIHRNSIQMNIRNYSSTLIYNKTRTEQTST